MVGRVSYLGRVKQGNYHTHVLYTIPNPNYTLPKPYPFIITYPIHHPTLGTQTGRVCKYQHYPTLDTYIFLSFSNQKRIAALLFWGQDVGSDCIISWSLLIFLLCISELLWLCRVVTIKSLPVHSFNALIITILRGVVCNHFSIFLSLDTFSIVLRAGCGIWLYQFLIIAYLFTFQTFNTALFKTNFNFMFFLN